MKKLLNQAGLTKEEGLACGHACEEACGVFRALVVEMCEEGKSIFEQEGVFPKFRNHTRKCRACKEVWDKAQASLVVLNEKRTPQEQEALKRANKKYARLLRKIFGEEGFAEGDDSKLKRGGISLIKAGVGPYRWAGLLMVNYRDTKNPDGQCLTQLVNELGDVVAEVLWSDRPYAARCITEAENDFRTLMRQGKLTSERVIGILKTYSN